MERIDHAPRQGPLRGEPQDAKAAEPIEDGEGDVLADGQIQDQRLQLAILRHETDAKADRIPGGVIADRLAVDQDLAAVEVVRAEDGAGDLGATGADQTGEANNLAGTNVEGNILQHDRRRILHCPGASETADLEDRRRRPFRQRRLASLGLFRTKEVAQGTADHQAHDAIGGRLMDR